MSIIQYSTPVVVSLTVTAATGYLAGVTTLEAVVVKPSGARATKTLADDEIAITNPTTGAIEVYLADDDLDEAGDYTLVLVDLTGGRWIPSTPARFRVAAAVVAPA